MTEPLMLLADRYRPRKFEQFTFNQPVIKRLRGLVDCQEIPHLIIQGGPGCGKKTLAWAFLREKFGSIVDQIQTESIEIGQASKTITLNVIQSPYHYQINPSLHGVYDRTIVQDFLKNLVKYRTVNQTTCPYRTVIIDQADQLTQEAQQSLRRTLETYVGSFRCLFICRSLDSLIPALQSRCLIVRVASPNQKETQQLISAICQKEQVNLPVSYLKMLIRHDSGNLTQILCDLEILIELYLKSESPKTDTDVTSSRTEAEVTKLKYTQISPLYQTAEEIVMLICQSSDLMAVIKIREKIYELLIHNSNPTDILKAIFNVSLRATTDPKTIAEIIQTSARHQDELEKGSKPIFHL